jgi:mRNA-degrading endonuclease RelE of RelBE toxin-antitoxin system
MPPNERFEVEILRQAEKDLDALRSRRDEAVREILKLENDPDLGHRLSGSLHGARSLEFNLKGSGAYRAVYAVIDERRICIVFIVGPHENIYKRAERRWESVKKQMR